MKVCNDVSGGCCEVKLDDPNRDDFVRDATDTFGSDLIIEEEDEKKSLELEGNSTKYIKITNTIQIPETESTRMIMDILKVIWEAILTGITRGFMPTMERYRRDTSSSHRGLIWL